MQELWKDIQGYEGFYQISNFGNVRSLDRILDCGRHVRGKVLRACGEPYLHIALTKNGVCKNHNIHRLVAQAFIPNPYSLPCINHKDENKHNNNVENLEWCTYEYNNDFSGVLEKATLSKIGKPLSDEHRHRMSESLKKSGKERARKRKATMQERYPDGFRHTEKSRQLLSEKLKGRPKSEETKQKMRKLRQ